MRRAALLVLLVAAAVGSVSLAAPPSVLEIDAGELAEAVAAAPPHSVLIADSGRQVEVRRTVRIDKPLTLVGLNLRLQQGLAKTPILEVVAEGVRIRDFALEGNGDSVEQADRAPLVVIRRGRFVIEHGRTDNSAKDGFMITPLPEYGDIEHGVIRDVTGRDTIRDIVSIGGRGHEGLYVRHLVVENIRSYGSRLRGPVEVSDGSEHITVRDVYAESSFYGVDIQDHSREGMVNRHILVDGVRVKDCVTAIRTANRDFGHSGLTIRNVSGEDFRASETWSPLHVRNTSDVSIENVTLRGGPRNLPWVFVGNGDNVTLRDVTLVDARHEGAALVIEDASNALVDNVVLAGDSRPARAVEYRIRSDRRFSGLRIRNVVAPGASEAGIALRNLSESGGIDSYAVTDNLATVEADLPARRRDVSRNF